MGAVAGLGIGLYDGQQHERAAQLRTEHRKLSALFENSSDCIAEIEYVDDRPIVRDVNPAFQTVFGYEREDICGESLDEMIVPAGERGEVDDINSRMNDGEQFESEVLRQTKDGEIRAFRLQAIPLDRPSIEASSAEIDGYAVYTDITAEHQYETRIAALHEATRELVTMGSVDAIATATVEAIEEILELGFAGVHLYDEDKAVLRPAAYTDRVGDVLGEPPSFERGEAIAWDVFESGEPTYIEDLHATEQAYNDASPLRSEMILPLGDYGVLLISARAPGAFDDSAFSLAKILAANVEVAMERAERERRLEEQKDRLETFASIVSHDLRNPIGIANGYLELAREGDETAFDRVEDALNRMEELTEDLLALAQRGQRIDDVETVDLATVARDAWANAATDDSTLRIESTGDVEADPERFQQLLENLFSNAVIHGSPSQSGTQSDAVERAPDSGDGTENEGEVGTEDVTVYVSRTDAGFVVEDDGVGIPEDERENVLARGYTTDDDGTGIGLAIVQEIADAHGWSVNVEEGRFGGAKFSFSVE
jgi:PAS domain S-box-containing protein